MTPRAKRKTGSSTTETAELKPISSSPPPPRLKPAERGREPADAVLLLSLSRQLEAAHLLIEDLQQRLETQATELYVARSDQQRSAALADELRIQLSDARLTIRGPKHG